MRSARPVPLTSAVLFVYGTLSGMCPHESRSDVPPYGVSCVLVGLPEPRLPYEQ